MCPFSKIYSIIKDTDYIFFLRCILFYFIQGLEGQPQGVKIFGTMLHSHLLGHAMRVRHFRGGAEQPVLAEDNNYDFDYQYTRIIGEEIDVLPVSDEDLQKCAYYTLLKLTHYK